MLGSRLQFISHKLRLYRIQQHRVVLVRRARSGAPTPGENAPQEVSDLSYTVCAGHSWQED